MTVLAQITKEKSLELKLNNGYKYLENGLYLIRGIFNGQQITIVNARKKIFAIYSKEEIDRDAVLDLLNQYWETESETKLDPSVEF